MPTWKIVILLGFSVSITCFGVAYIIEKDRTRAKIEHAADMKFRQRILMLGNKEIVDCLDERHPPRWKNTKACNELRLYIINEANKAEEIDI